MESYKTIVEVISLIKDVAERKEITQKDKNNINRLVVKTDVSYLQKKHAMKAWTNMLNALEKGMFEKALNHAKKVMLQIRPVANDSPFKVKDKIAVIRYEHGWLDGRMEAIIKKCFQRDNGVWSYLAQVVKIENEEINDKDYLIEIRHTRDATLLY